MLYYQIWNFRYCAVSLFARELNLLDLECGVLCRRERAGVESCFSA